MNHQEGTFQGLYDTEIFYQNWTPEHVKGVVLITHGFGEHSGRYMNVVDTLVPEGYAVWGIDHRGHGRSGGKRNFLKRFTDFLEDVKTFEEIARKTHSNLPFHLIGHSMGSLIANNYIALYADQNKFKSLVLSGTGADTGPGISSFTVKLAKFMSAILPGMMIPSNLDPTFISHDEKVIEAYMNDPLVNYVKITTRLASEMFAYLLKMKEAAGKIELPVMMQVGSEDDAFNSQSWEPLINCYSNEDKALKIYEGFRHEVYNEIKKEIPLEDLKIWINQHN